MRLQRRTRSIAFIGGNVLFQTSDGGKHWKAISPDLTRNDKSKQQVSKNSVTHDESGAENYGTILDIETSARNKGEIWTGSDDGLVHLTRDGGAHWLNVTPPALPADSAVETVALSTLRNGTAYVSADRHAMGDNGAYIFVTRDYGAHWQSVTNGIPAGEYVRAVRPDSANAGIVYAGTNRGIHISCDGGASWRSFQNNLPAVEVRDIRIQPQFDDLVIATHGRAIWVMDDIRAVQQSACAMPTAPLVIGPRPAIDLINYRDDEGNYTDFEAQNPSGGLLSGGGAVASLYYWLPAQAKKRPTIDVYDQHGRLLRHVEGEHDVFTGEEARVVLAEPQRRQERVRLRLHDQRAGPLRQRTVFLPRTRRRPRASARPLYHGLPSRRKDVSLHAGQGRRSAIEHDSAGVPSAVRTAAPRLRSLRARGHDAQRPAWPARNARCR